jgi:hypothetical protein
MPTDGTALAPSVRAQLRRLPQSVRWRWHRLRHHGFFIEEHGLRTYLRWSAFRATLRARDLAAGRHYRRLSSRDAAARRRSDRVFIFGSGYSLNDLTPAEWQHFAEHDVFGFNGFVYQRWVRTDFHLVRSWVPDFRGADWQRRAIAAYAERIRANAHFDDTVFVLQRQYSAEVCNMLVGERFLPEGAMVCRYRTARRLDEMPSPRWRAGLQREPGTLATVVNAAVLLGWREIVLVGVDLYDNRYFWGPADATMHFDASGIFADAQPRNDRNLAWNEPHNTVRGGIVDVLGRWRGVLEPRGIHLAVYNPRSLLTRVLPLYPRPAQAAAGVAAGGAREEGER